MTLAIMQSARSISRVALKQPDTAVAAVAAAASALGASAALGTSPLLRTSHLVNVRLDGVDRFNSSPSFTMDQ